MLIERFYRFIESIIKEHELHNITNLIEQALFLCSNRGNIPDTSYQSKASELRSLTNEILENTVFNTIPSYIHDMIRDSQYPLLNTQHICNFIIKSLPNNRSLIASSGEVNSFRETYIQHRNVAISLLSTLRGFNFKPEENGINYAFIDLTIPKNDQTSLYETSNILHDFDDFLKPIVEHSTGSREEIYISSISTTDIVTTIMVALASVPLFLIQYTNIVKAINESLTLLKSLRELRKASLVTVDENLEKAVEKGRDSKIESNTNRNLESIDSPLDNGRKSEISIELSGSSKIVATHIMNGVSLSLTFLNNTDIDLLCENTPNTDGNTDIRILLQQKHQEDRILVQFLSVDASPALLPPPRDN